MSRLGGEADALLRDVVEELAALDRRAGSEGERRAAELIAERLNAAGARAAIEEEQFLDGYARLMGSLTAAGVVAGFAALAGARKPATAVGAVAAAAIADDISNGPRVIRKLVEKPKTTWNVVAEAGDSEATETLVVLAHHDAAPTGFIFDETLQRELGDRFPGVLERIDTSLPQWQAVVAGPALVAYGALKRNRAAIKAGMAMGALATAAFADIARSAVVPGANDNLSAVGALVVIAERLRAEPVKGLRVLLVSCGAEEVLQGGIHGFAARWFPRLDREHT